MRTERPDRREATRLPRIESVSIELRSADRANERPTRVVSTRTLDVSADGLRILLPAPVETDCLLDLCVELLGQARPFFLTGESRWCRALPHGDAFEAGLLIYDGEGTDYPDWAALFAGQFEPGDAASPPKAGG
jgi:hypothetical protein